MPRISLAWRMPNTAYGVLPHRPTGRGLGVDGFGQRLKLNLAFFQIVKKTNQIMQRPSEPVELPYNQDIIHRHRAWRGICSIQNVAALPRLLYRHRFFGTLPFLERRVANRGSGHRSRHAHSLFSCGHFRTDLPDTQTFDFMKANHCPINPNFSDTSRFFAYFCSKLSSKYKPVNFPKQSLVMRFSHSRQSAMSGKRTKFL